MNDEAIAPQHRSASLPIPVPLLIALVVGVLIALVTGGLLLLVSILNHGVDPAWIIFLTSSLPHLGLPLP